MRVYDVFFIILFSPLPPIKPCSRTPHCFITFHVQTFRVHLYRLPPPCRRGRHTRILYIFIVFLFFFFFIWNLRTLRDPYTPTIILLSFTVYFFKLFFFFNCNLQCFDDAIRRESRNHKTLTNSWNAKNRLKRLVSCVNYG